MYKTNPYKEGIKLKNSLRTFNPITLKLFDEEMQLQKMSSSEGLRRLIEKYLQQKGINYEYKIKEK